MTTASFLAGINRVVSRKSVSCGSPTGSNRSLVSQGRQGTSNNATQPREAATTRNSIARIFACQRIVFQTLSACVEAETKKAIVLGILHQEDRIAKQRTTNPAENEAYWDIDSWRRYAGNECNNPGSGGSGQPAANRNFWTDQGIQQPVQSPSSTCSS